MLHQATGFNGNGSFVTNHYVVYQKGFASPPYNDVKPNIKALRHGIDGIRTLTHPNSHPRSAFNLFISHLEKVYERELAKEKRYLEFKKQQLIQQGAVDIANKLQTAMDAGEFNAAFMLISHTQEELKKLIVEAQDYIGRKSNYFWDEQFGKYVGEVFSQNLEYNQQKQLFGKIGSNMTLGQFIDNYVDQVVNNTYGDQFLDTSKKAYKEKYLDQFGAKLEKIGIFPKTWNRNTTLFTNKMGNSRNFSALLKNRKNAGKYEYSIEGLGEDLAGNLMLGMASELQSMQSAKNRAGANSIVVSTGENRRRNASGKKVYQKADVTSIEIATASTTIQLPKNIQKFLFDGELEKNWEEIREEIIRLNESLGEIFETFENVKGYKSENNLQIEGTGSFVNRAANIVKLAQQSDGLGYNSFDKLVFMLNNTVSGCIADQKIDVLADYIAAICVAWMWDDYDEIYAIQERTGVTTKLHLFNSGGYYYTASGIMRQVLDNLMTTVVSKEEVDSFVQVDIKPPKPHTQSDYDSLVARNSITNIPKENIEQWMSVLKTRWDIIRDEVEKGGTVAIHFKQNELSELLGNLSIIM